MTERIYSVAGDGWRESLAQTLAEWGFVAGFKASAFVHHAIASVKGFAASWIPWLSDAAPFAAIAI